MYHANPYTLIQTHSHINGQTWIAHHLLWTSLISSSHHHLITSSPHHLFTFLGLSFGRERTESQTAECCRQVWYGMVWCSFKIAFICYQLYGIWPLIMHWDHSSCALSLPLHWALILHLILLLPGSYTDSCSYICSCTSTSVFDLTISLAFPPALVFLFPCLHSDFAQITYTAAVELLQKEIKEGSVKFER